MKRYFLFVLSLVLVYPLVGQHTQLKLGADEIGLNQVWTITATVTNVALRSYSGFPEIEGFKKRGTSTQSQTTIVNGQMNSSQSVTMQYVPLRQGMFTLAAFTLKINENTVSSSGKTIRVGAPIQQQHDPFRNFFDPLNRSSPTAKTEFVDVEADAFLAITSDKNEVYVGEGFTATLSFLVSDNNRASMQFHNLSTQLATILKKIRPASCWEENFNIESIEGKHIRINNKNYTQYKIYQTTFYPLNTKPIRFPSIGLEMIKYKVAKNPSFFGRNRKEDYKTFYSKSKTVNVKELPPHPLRNSVAVGDYRLNDVLTPEKSRTGQSVTYDFTIYGEGNISSIEKPILKENDDFDFYSPNINQRIKRENGRITGTKSFSYYIIPKEPGVYSLSDYFSWIFFNPKTHQYDTLRGHHIAYITGESKKNQTIASSRTGSFYDQIFYADDTLYATRSHPWKLIGMNMLIFLTVGGTLFMIIKKN